MLRVTCSVRLLSRGKSSDIYMRTRMKGFVEGCVTIRTNIFFSGYRVGSFLEIIEEFFDNMVLVKYLSR